MATHSKNERRVFSIVATIVLTAGSQSATAQTLPWDTFIDDASSSVCDLVNAGNTKLVVLNTTRQFVIVTGNDVTLADTFVDTAGNVFFEGEPAGVIAFALDGNGSRTVWWLALTGEVVEVDARVNRLSAISAPRPLPTPRAMRVCSGTTSQRVKQKSPNPRSS